MSAAVMMKRIAEASPRFKARMAGGIFLVLGFLAELALMLWLLVMGVDVQRWKEQARTA